MTRRHHWFRLSIDVDASGNPVGASYEVHLAETTTAVHVLENPGPFDTCAETLERLLADVTERYGIWAQLDM